MMTTETKAVVIDADGHFGYVATVWYAGTVEQCRRFARRGNCQVIVGCEKGKGDKITAAGLRDCLARGDWSVDK